MTKTSEQSVVATIGGINSYVRFDDGWKLTQDHTGKLCRVFDNDTHLWESAIVIGADIPRDVCGFMLGGPHSGHLNWPTTRVRLGSGKVLEVNPLQLVFLEGSAA